jgi:hypothetical protein
VTELDRVLPEWHFRELHPTRVDARPERVFAAVRRPNADFVPFDEPGYARMASSFRLDGRTLSTETRVLLTGDRSRRAFRRYWLLLRPFCGLVRRVWLRAIEQRAEARAR